MSADQEFSRESTRKTRINQEKKGEADLRAERSTTEADNSIGLSYHWSGLERSDRIKDLRRLGPVTVKCFYSSAAAKR
jgi:hypothetical protein